MLGRAVKIVIAITKDGFSVNWGGCHLVTAEAALATAVAALEVQHMAYGGNETFDVRRRVIEALNDPEYEEAVREEAEELKRDQG